jgi:UDP:flavonoid glycosyltransferase YjiC (YdhE family)
MRPPPARPTPPRKRPRLVPQTVVADTRQVHAPGMRVLVVSSPMVGHILPLLPLADAVRDAGHEVLFATGPEGLEAARSSGLDVRDVAPGLRIGPVFGKAALRHPVGAVRAARGRDRGTRFVGVLLSGAAARMLEGLTSLAEEWGPDLVVSEALAGASGLVAAARDLPVVVVNMTLFDGAELFRSATDALSAQARRRGISAVRRPAEVLNLAPASLVDFTSGRPMRFVPVAGRDVPAPDDLLRPGERPRIVVGRSTVADPRPDRLMSSVVAAAADADVEVVLVRPDKRVARRPLPANVRTTDYVPFSSVFRAAAGTVHHGGAGTLLTALSAGIPQLVVPGTGDRTVNAELVARRGVGLAVPAARITSGHLEQLATDPALAAATREVAEEIATMPAPADMVGDLTALVR